MSLDSAATIPFNVGDVLAGKYRIDRILGAGGMGVVVAATHLDLDTKVAIKVMREELVADSASVQRLLLEARAAARIRSEHVARVLDVGTLPSGVPYIVMEYLAGCDLGQLLETRGRLQIAESVDYLLEACEALAEAHVANIVHRDLKPENLFVAERADGSTAIKVVDFGISKQIGAEGKGRALTNPSSAVGSPQYMAPEQMQARAVDQRVDVWALGAILYELLSGQHAFNGETLPEVCAQVLSSEPVSLRSLRPEVPAELELVLQHCLRKNPGERMPDVAALAFALAPFGTLKAQVSVERVRRVLHGSGTQPVPVSVANRAAGVAATLALATGGAHTPVIAAPSTATSGSGSAVFSATAGVPVVGNKKRTTMIAVVGGSLLVAAVGIATFSVRTKDDAGKDALTTTASGESGPAQGGMSAAALGAPAPTSAPNAVVSPEEPSDEAAAVRPEVAVDTGGHAAANASTGTAGAMDHAAANASTGTAGAGATSTGASAATSTGASAATSTGASAATSTLSARGATPPKNASKSKKAPAEENREGAEDTQKPWDPNSFGGRR